MKDFVSVHPPIHPSWVCSLRFGLQLVHFGRYGYGVTFFAPGQNPKTIVYF
jgi:hypothetical protein